MDTYSHVTPPIRSGTAARFDRVLDRLSPEAFPHFSPKPTGTLPND